MNPQTRSGDVPKELGLSSEQLAELMARQRDGSKGPRSHKPPKVGFLQFSIPFLLRLRLEKAPCIVWTMVWALSEAWFITGLGSEHLNPFPLAAIDTEKWKLPRNRKSQALRFLERTRLIKVDRSEPRNPKVTLSWVQLNPP